MSSFAQARNYHKNPCLFHKVQVPAGTYWGLPPEAGIPAGTYWELPPEAGIPAAGQVESKGTAEEAGGSLVTRR